MEIGSFCCCVTNTLSRDEEKYDDEKYTCTPVRIGKNILFYGRRRSRWPMQCHVGPDWLTVVYVYMAIIVVNAVVLGIVSPLGWPVTVIGGTGTLLLLYAYSVVALSDPGIVYKERESSALTEDGVGLNNDEKTPEETSHRSGNECCKTHNSDQRGFLNPSSNIQQIECGSCEINRPITASHCSTCGVCIDRLDHHCPFCGKCIGGRTLKMFYTFICLLQAQTYFLLSTFIYYIIAVYVEPSWPKGPYYP